MYTEYIFIPICNSPLLLSLVQRYAHSTLPNALLDSDAAAISRNAKSKTSVRDDRLFLLG